VHKVFAFKGRWLKSACRPDLPSFLGREGLAFWGVHLKIHRRKKDGKEHRYFSIIESRRVLRSKVVHRTVLYLGEINDSQQCAWRKTLEVFDEDRRGFASLSLFPEDRELPADAVDGVQVKLSEMRVERPRTFGGCWLGCELWRQLKLDEFWQARLPEGREGVPWEKVLRLLVVNRLIEPGSEFRVHRHWFDQTAMAELLAVNFAVAEKDRLYRCLDRILTPKTELFQHLRQRWQDLFATRFDLLLYDLTSTYVEGEAEGPPRGKIRQYEAKWTELPWRKVRESVEVKRFAEEGELYVLAKSAGRPRQEMAIRRRKRARLLWRLRALRRACPRRDALLMKIGAAKSEAGQAFGFVKITVPKAQEEVTRQTFQFRLERSKLEEAERRDGHYLLRTNLTGENPQVLWDRYMQLTQIEAAFKCLKSALGIRPIYHQVEHRVESHILIAFLAYGLWVTLKQRLQAHAPGLTPKAVLEKLAGMQMLDVSFPTTDGRRLVMPRYTEPTPEQKLLLHELQLVLPAQPPPRITVQPEIFPAGMLRL
jgi:hypothetical protein